MPGPSLDSRMSSRAQEILAAAAADALSGMEHTATWADHLQVDEHRRGEQARCTTAEPSAGAN
jgi:hypothetical protein